MNLFRIVLHENWEWVLELATTMGLVSQIGLLSNIIYSFQIGQKTFQPSSKELLMDPGNSMGQWMNIKLISMVQRKLWKLGGKISYWNLFYFSYFPSNNSITNQLCHSNIWIWSARVRVFTKSFRLFGTWEKWKNVGKSTTNVMKTERIWRGNF